MSKAAGISPHDDDLADDSVYRLRPVSGRFDDRAREQQFFKEQLPVQRQVTFGSMVMVLLIVAVQWPLSWLSPQSHLPASSNVWLAAAFALGVVLALGLRVDRSYRVTHRWLIAGVVLVPLIFAIVVVAGFQSNVQPVMLSTTVVVALYLTSRLDLIGSTVGAMWYSVAVFLAWLLFRPPDDQADVIYAGLAALLTHVAGYSSAAWMHRELRIGFAQRQHLRALSTIDALSGLLNRRAFDDRLTEAWAAWRAAERAPTVLMADIDHFKRFNDTLGHAAGDEALRMVAAAIRGALGFVPDAVAARYGGEEFVILLPAADRRAVLSIAERIAEAVRQAGRSLAAAAELPLPSPLTISIGVAVATVDMHRAADLVAAADRALYQAKADGRDCVRSAR